MGKTAFKDATRGNVHNLPPELLRLVTDKAHPLYDPRVNDAADKAMAENMIVHGIVEPLIVCKDDKYPGEPVVVDGRRRTRAAMLANKMLAARGSKDRVKAPCILRGGKAVDLLSVLISANEHRKDDTVLAKARKAFRLEALGKRPGVICTDFGISATTLGKWRKLVALPAAVQNAVEKNKISAEAAIQLHGLEPAEQKAHLAQMLAASGNSRKARTARSARKAAKRTGKSNGKRGPRSLREDIYPLLRDDGTFKVTCDEYSSKRDAYMAGVRWAFQIPDGAEIPGAAK